MKYTCIDAFSGAGGLSLGLQWAGFDILLAFDNDSNCVETHNTNHQYFSHKVYRANVNDMLNGRLLDEAGLKRGQLFLLAGGPPCQGFSIQRIGVDHDKRNNLVIKFVDLLAELFPAHFLMENVPGIKGKRGRVILEEVLREAERLGYWVHYKELDAQDYGVPQRRRRVFVVGERCDYGLARLEFPQPTTPFPYRVTVRQAIGDLPGPPEDGKEHLEIANHRRDKLSELNKRRLKALKPGEGREHLPQELLANCHRLSPSLIGHRNVYGRMAWDTVAPTITARFDSFTRGQFGHPEEIRSITLREGAILQTFPMDFAFAGNKVEIARQIGNAVPPVLAKVIGEQIINCYLSKKRLGVTHEL